jgi:hypothetical protein
MTETELEESVPPESARAPSQGTSTDSYHRQQVYLIFNERNAHERRTAWARVKERVESW